MTKFAQFLILITIVSCSSLTQRRASNEIASMYSKGEYQSLVNKIKKKDFYKREQDRFLKQAELGTLFFRLGNYQQALDSFRAARDISDDLYKIRLSKKIKSFLLNDSEDIYYPNPYELSMIRFYEILSVIKILETENKSQNKVMLESLSRDWQAYLDNLKDRKLGEADFKGVVLADLLAYVLHGYLGTRSDISQMKSFRKIAKRNLKTKMGLYESYNEKFKVYRKDFSKLHRKSNKELFSKYIGKTQVYSDVESFLKMPYRQILVVLRGNIKTKKPKKYTFPIDLFGVAATNNLSKGDFVSFSTRILSLTSATNPKIAFELPTIKSTPRVKNDMFNILNSDKVIFSGRSIMASNNSEVMKKLLDEESSKAKVRVGTKLVAKHLGILLTAYGTYRLLRDKQGEFVAYLTAAASYAVANKAVEAMELADLRSWGGIHDYVDFVPLSLKKGDYTLDYLGNKIPFKVTGQKKQIIPLVL